MILRRMEQGLVRAADRMLDASSPPNPFARALGARYLRHRHLALHRAIRAGWLWVPSPWRLAIALAVERGDRVLDLGANLGRVSQEAAWRVGPEGRVDAFEPSPTVAERLRRRMERLGLDDRVAIHRCAIGDQAGTATLYEYAHRDGGASSLRPQEHVGTSPDHRRSIPMVTLDAFLASEGRGSAPTLIKIDVEGAEVEVLEGARRSLTSPQRRPVLVVEAAPVTQQAFGRSVQPLLDALHELGYTLQACRRDGLATVTGEADLAEGRRRQDLLALHPADHGELLDHLKRLARRRAT